MFPNWIISTCKLEQEQSTEIFLEGRKAKFGRGEKKRKDRGGEGEGGRDNKISKSGRRNWICIAEKLACGEERKKKKKERGEEKVPWLLEEDRKRLEGMDSQPCTCVKKRNLMEHNIRNIFYKKKDSKLLHTTWMQ